MSPTTTDKSIRDAVLKELEWEPQVNSTEIGVSVKDGVVTLTGFVDSYVKKYSAERAVKRISGVRAVANDLEVKLPTARERHDPDIAQDAIHALKWRFWLPNDRIRLTVRNGWITLEGNVDWQYQVDAADPRYAMCPV